MTPKKLDVQVHANGWQLGESIFVCKEAVTKLPAHLTATNLVAYRGTVEKYVVEKGAGDSVSCVGCKPTENATSRIGVAAICGTTPPTSEQVKQGGPLPASTTTIFVDRTTLAATAHYGEMGAATEAASKSVPADNGLWLFAVDEVAAASPGQTIAFTRHPEGKRFFFFAV